MQTITFTNRERIMISDDKNAFLEYLSHKLPPADYSSEHDPWAIDDRKAKAKNAEL